MAQRTVAVADDDASAAQSLLSDSTSMEELRRYERAYYDEMNRGGASNKTRFAYAKALVRYKYWADTRKGIMLLEDLCSTQDAEARKDYLFYLAVANTKIKEYDRAQECIKKFLALSPTDRQGKQLEKIIEKRMTEEELKKYAIAGGAAAVVGALIGLGLALGRRK